MKKTNKAARSSKEQQKEYSIFTPGKRVYSDCFPEYRLTDEELLALQKCLLGIFLDIKKLCDENGIKYMMASGSTLGVIRHQGFIPWDDDIDLKMTRENYLKFRKAFKAGQKAGRLGEYILAEPFKSREYYFKMPKVYKKNTEYSQVDYMGNPHWNMVGVDLFIVEYMPESRLQRLLYQLVFDFAFYASSFCLDVVYPSPAILEKSRKNKGLKRFYQKRTALGKLFQTFGGIRFYLEICRRISEYSKKTALMGVPCGISYAKEIFDSSVYEDLTTGMFCGHEVSIPRHYDVYLRNVYGDYMELPPEEKREIHTAYRISL